MPYPYGNVAFAQKGEPAQKAAPAKGFVVTHSRDFYPEGGVLSAKVIRMPDSGKERRISNPFTREKKGEEKDIPMTEYFLG